MKHDDLPGGVEAVSLALAASYSPVVRYNAAMEVYLRLLSEAADSLSEEAPFDRVADGLKRLAASRAELRRNGAADDG